MKKVLGFLCVIIFFLACFISLAATSTHWVSPTGTATYANCASATPLSGTSACSLVTANNNAVAGDLVYLRAGTYTTALSPAHSGTGTLPNGPWNFITFSGYTGETATIQLPCCSTYQMILTGRSFIRVTNLNFNGSLYNVNLGAHHNEIDHNTFISTSNGALNFQLSSLATTAAGPWSTHNWVHDNSFTQAGQAFGNGGAGCTDGAGDAFDIGHAESSTYPYEGDNNNTVEGNVFNHGPHAIIESAGVYTVIRNNVMHNEPWSQASAACLSSGYTVFQPTYSSSNPNYTAYDGYYAHRNIEITEDGYGRTQMFQLLEGNRIGFAGVNQSNSGADNIDIAGPQMIVRYNYSYAAMNVGIRFKYPASFSGSIGGINNRVYNNTIYQNGYGYPTGQTCSQPVCPWGQSAIESENSTGNVVINNLIYLDTRFSTSGFDVSLFGSNSWNKLYIAQNNWCSGTQTGGDSDQTGHHGCTATGDPKFNNPDLTQPSSLTLPDLSLQSGSPALSGGTALTTATNSGSKSTTLTVSDAMFFQDGSWGSDLSRVSAGLGGTLQPDWIAIGSVTNVVQIKSITYGTPTNPAGTITLAFPATWNSGASIWLYKKSDGIIVLLGNSPAYGASEGILQLLPPTIASALPEIPAYNRFFSKW